MADANVNAAAPLRLLFAGTPEFSAFYLNALLDSKHRLIAVYTQPDRPAGRGKKLQSSPVKQLAEQAGIRVYQPPSLRDPEQQTTLGQHEADVLVVVAYGLILPQAVLDAPRLGCLNVHASLLPRWRGAAPIQRAIEAGDQVTGVTIMQMDAGLDTGAMLATAECAIGGQTTAAALHDQLAELGAPLLLTVLDKLQEYQRNGVRQNDARSSYAGKISKAEAEIDWRRDAVELDRAIRAFNPFPVCYSFLGGERIKLWQAMPAATITAPEAPGTLLRADREGILVSCGRGLLLVQQLQLPGGRVLTAEQLLNANSALFAPGNQFTLPGAGTS
jgi:methionyl-tRNA formyltransferase